MYDHHLKHPEQIVNIPDKDFFASLDLEAVSSKSLTRAVAEGDYQVGYSLLWDALKARSKPVHPSFTDRERILERIPRNQKLADQILNGETYRIDQVVYDFSRPIDFNAPTGVTNKHGFHYLAWMDCLVHAGVQSGNRSYLEAYLNLFRQWYEQRESITRARKENDVIFYELGLVTRNVRFINFLYATLFLGAGDLLKPRDIEYIFKTLLGGARWLVMEQEEKGYRDGNWQLFSVWYLLQYGILFPEFKESAKFREIGSYYLEEHMVNDFYGDGCHSERCFSYGLNIITQFSELLQFVEQNPDLPIPHRFDWREKTAPMFEFYLKMVAPGAEFPGLNDGEFMKRQSYFAATAKLRNDNRYLWPLQNLVPAWEQQAVDPGYRSIVLPESGFCVLRDGFAPDSTYMLLNFGDFPGLHSHFNLLDFALYANGFPLAAEVGRFNGYDQPWDLYFRSPQAHNQVTVEGATMERTEARGEAIQFGTSCEVDFFSGFHKAYYHTAGVILERRVFYLKNLGHLICDCGAKVNPQPERALYNSARNSYQWHLHSPFPFTIGQYEVRAESQGKGLLIVPENNRWLSHAYTGIDYLPENTEEFPHWKAREQPVLWPERHFLNLRAWPTNHPATSIDVFLAAYEGTPPQIKITSLPCSSTGDAPGYVVPRVLEVRSDPEQPHWMILLSDPVLLLSFEGGRFRGHAAAIKVENGKYSGVFLQDVKHLELEGKSVSGSTPDSPWIDLS